MTAFSRWICGSICLSLCLWAATVETAWASQVFPALEIREAHALRQRILAEIPELEPRQMRERPRLSPETLALSRQRLETLRVREAENPFFHWAEGELLRYSQGPAAGAPAFDRARQAAGQRLLVHWLLWQDYLAGDLLREAEREERSLQAIQLTWGLTRFPLLATEQIRLGIEAADSGDMNRALSLYEAALANVPESREALFGRASLVWQMDKTRVFEIVRDLAAGLSLSFRGEDSRFRLTTNLLLSLLMAWLVALCLVALVFAIKLQPLFAHEISERVLKRLPPGSQASLGLLLFFLPLTLGLGLFWTAIASLVVSAPYMIRRERGLVALVLTILVALPFGYEWVAARHILASSRQLTLAQIVEQGGRGESLVQELQDWAQRAPDDGLPHYYLGLVLKRRGELARAQTEMAEAARILPQAGFIQVGLGNLQYLLGQLPEAEETYRRAAAILPKSAAVQLNLSKLYTQRLQLDLSKEALARSLALDPHMGRTVSPFHGEGFTQFVIDEAVPRATLAAAFVAPTAERRVLAEGFWGRPLRGVSLSLLPYAVGVLLILFWIHVRLRGSPPPVRRCQQCGTPFCRRCQTNPKETQYCLPCAVVFRQRDGVTAFVRGRRMREGEEWLRRERVRTGILGGVIPGGGDLFAGRLVRGILLCVLAVWLFAEGFLLDALTPSLRFAPSLPSPIRYTVTSLLLLVLYLFSARRSWGSSFTAGP